MPRIRRAVPLVLAALAVAACADEEAAKAREAALREELRAEIERTRKDVDRAERSLQAARDDARALKEEVQTLAARVTSLEERPVPAAGGGAAAHSADAAKPAAPDQKALLAEMESLQDKVMSGEATDAEEERFWELARTTKAVDSLMKGLEQKVKESPDNLDLRMQLAQAYYTKLMTVPAGMEQGMWSNRAEQQLNEVLKRDENHWDARFSRAFSWTFWPEQFNRTPDAIKEFEKLREVQERQTVDAKHAQTYVQLARLYVKQGKTDKAKETLRAGLGRHPDDAELRKALGAMEE